MEWRHGSEKEEVKWEKGLGLGGKQIVGVITTLWPGPVYSKFQEAKGTEYAWKTKTSDCSEEHRIRNCTTS